MDPSLPPYGLPQSPAECGGGGAHPGLAECHVVQASVAPFLSGAADSASPRYVSPGQPGLSGGSPSPSLESAGVPCDAADSGAASVDLSSAPRAPPPPDDPLPVEEVAADHPLFGCDVDSLVASDRLWIQSEFLSYYTEATQWSMTSKFKKFQAFCEANDLAFLPTCPATIYCYIRFLREEGRVGVQSLLQYLAAISMVHHMAGHLHFSAFDQVTRRLAQAWRRQQPALVHSHTPVPSDLLLAILYLGLATPDPCLLRAACSAVLNFIFFNRAQSGHLLTLEDMHVENDLLVFHKCRTKLKPDMGPQSRGCSWSINGAPQVVDLVLRWSAVRDKAWADAGDSPGYFYTLPGERDPGAWTISGWFGPLLQALPSPPVEHFDHHGLRTGGATACYALEVPERRIRLWGDLRNRAMWSYIDVLQGAYGVGLQTIWMDDHNCAGPSCTVRAHLLPRRGIILPRVTKVMISFLVQFNWWRHTYS